MAWSVRMCKTNSRGLVCCLFQDLKILLVFTALGIKSKSILAEKVGK
ncbi:MAG: hypothetical protein ACKERG_02460 [Candidatus Hodgkinia cicadicola]